jgi:hypothetical protein
VACRSCVLILTGRRERKEKQPRLISLAVSRSCFASTDGDRGTLKPSGLANASTQPRRVNGFKDTARIIADTSGPIMSAIIAGPLCAAEQTNLFLFVRSAMCHFQT